MQNVGYFLQKTCWVEIFLTSRCHPDEALFLCISLYHHPGLNWGKPSQVKTIKVQNDKSFAATIVVCSSVLKMLLSKVVDQPWHAKCLSCASCAQPLREKCFVKNRSLLDQLRQQLTLTFPSSDVFCREDFFRKYGTKCAGCQEGIAPSSVVSNIHIFSPGISSSSFRWGEHKSTSTTLTASSASSAQGNWWGSKLLLCTWSLINAT